MLELTNALKQEGSMGRETEVSGRNETLATCLYTSLAESPPCVLKLYLTHFEYTIHRKTLLDEVAAKFGNSLTQELSPEHRALVEHGEEQTPEDIALANRMRTVQREALMA
jgi:hypothetical protein